MLMERCLLHFFKKLTRKMNIFLIKIPVGFFVETAELTMLFMKKSRELGLARVFLESAARRASPGQGSALLSKAAVSETAWHRPVHRHTLCLTWA